MLSLLAGNHPDKRRESRGNAEGKSGQKAQGVFRTRSRAVWVQELRNGGRRSPPCQTIIKSVWTVKMPGGGSRMYFNDYISSLV